MNFTETTLPRKTPWAKVPFMEYPKTVYHVDGRTRIVKSDAEEDAAFEEGFSENPPLLRPVLPQATLSTAAGAQSSYDLLKKQFDETVREFNIKYADLERKHKRATDNIDLLKMALEQKDTELQKLVGLLKAKAAAYTSAREVEVAPAQDPQG